MDVRQMQYPGVPMYGTPTVRLDAVRDAPFTDQVRVAASNVVDAMLNSIRGNVSGLIDNTMSPQAAQANYWNELFASPIVWIAGIGLLVLLLRK